MIILASRTRFRLRGLVSFPFVGASSSPSFSSSSPKPPSSRQVFPPVSSRIEHVKIQSGSSGQVALNLHRPSLRSAKEADDASVVIFLPRGPMVTRGRVPDDQIVSLLSEYLPNSTIVRVNYRWDDQHRFPIAVHDTLAAYDWILKNLIDVSPNTSDDEPSPAPAPRMPRIGLCGELIGGGLATMLALTECQAGKPSITAAAVNSPVLDWTFGLDQSTSSSSSSGDAVTAADGEQDLPIPTSTHPKKRPSKGRTHHSSWTQFSSNARLSAKDLSRARDMFFRTPDSYFDPFASPVLFFRTAGVDLPTDEDPSLLVPDPTIQATSTTNTTSKPHRRTTTHRRYPPTGMGLQLPSMRISVGKENILLDQGAELASLMRRSILISETQAGEKFADHENIADPKLFDGGRNDGRERVQLVRREGTALWCYPDEGGSTPSGVKEAGEWLEEVLRVT